MLKKISKSVWYTILIMLLVVFILLPMCSCSSNSSESLAVVSESCPSLTQMKAGEFNERVKQDLLYGDHPYFKYSCRVSSKNGKLQVDILNSTQPESLSQMFDYGYILGVDLGEFDGWVKYYPYNTNVLHKEPYCIANENCCGIIPIDRTHGYILTGERGILLEGKSGGCLYYFSHDGNEKTYGWNFEKVGTFGGKPAGYLYSESEKALYVVTDKTIETVNENHEITKIADSEILSYIVPNSIVLLDENFYCGSGAGVYCYCTATGEEIWYPMEYSDGI